MNHADPKDLAHALLEEAGDALFLFDPDNDQLYEVSRMALELTGFSREELLAHPATYYFRFGGKGGQKRLRDAAAHTGVFHGQEGFFLRTSQDGTWIPVSLTVSRLHVKPRTLALMTARDVREAHEAHARLAQMEGELRRVMASVSDCLWSGECSTNRWLYHYFSPVVENLTGRPLQSFLGGLQPWQNIVHPDDVPAWRRAIEQLRRGQSTQEEYRVVWPDGASAGAVAGAVAGSLLPGVGTVIGGIGGAALGAAGGTFLGPFLAMEISEEDANHYSNVVNQGRTLVIVRQIGRSEEAREVLHNHGGCELNEYLTQTTSP